MFIIYLLTLKGNPMGPIKSPHSFNAYLKSAGTSPVLRRPIHLKAEQTALYPTACHPPFLLLALQTFARLLAVPKITWGCQFFQALGQEGWGRAGLAFEVREGPRSQLEGGLEYSRHKIGKERGPVVEEKSKFKFCSREK